MPNRLNDEQSPYLLQHADNPVDWYPWCDEAFEKAKAEDRPIFLSIGYSTCHWCHVMAHESFEDPDVAELMNETFVSIKVDREERPEIDDIYMTVCQMITGRGGWPLNVVMTPDQEPFFAATYIPKTNRGRQMGMLDLVPRIRKMWEENREEALESAEQVMQSLEDATEEAPGDELTEETIERAVERMANQYDPTFGGFGNAPKFPSPHNLLLLLRFARRSDEEEPLEMVETTLRSMRQGGLFDQVGYGFHRYSTDRQWLLPHFEKMLYDQALLSIAYLEAYQVTDRETYRDTVEKTLAYVLRDLRAPEGGFYSAEDADSEEGEGVFYQWTVDEIYEVLGEEDGDLAVEMFNLAEEGNFREESSDEKTGRNILFPGRPEEEIAADLDLSVEAYRTKRKEIRDARFEAREKRERPHLDDKTLTDWNGLMISALSRAAAVMDRERYREAAESAAEFLLDRLRTDDGRLLHRYRDGETAVPGNAGDYAFFIRGLIDLYGATFEASYLRTALALNEDFIDHFWDDGEGGFYFTADDAEQLITRRKTIHDGARPSANSVAYLNLLHLARMTGRTELEDRALELETAFSQNIDRSPFSFTMFLCGLSFRTADASEVVVAGNPDGDETQHALNTFRSSFLPHSVLLFRPTPSGSGNESITELAPYTNDMTPTEDGAPAIYVCSNFACRAPTSDVAEALDAVRDTEAGS